MSAITGIYHCDNSPINTEHGKTLMQALEKFPANHIHTWQKENIFLGCHDQWLTPESLQEQKPFHDYERQLVITADAVIDNRKELFERLQVESSRRNSITDSQLILLAYEKWGEASPKYLIGDFTFMIWDERKMKLFGVRDYSGARTLYYHHNQNCFTFCTIIEPLLSLPYIKRELNEQWLAEYLAIPTMVDAVDIHTTVYKNIEQLPPSHSISISSEGILLRRYCTLPEGNQLRLKSNGEYIEAFREVFQQAISARLRTHRKVGAHLSGGLDSSAVVSFAAPMLQKENKRLHTFSYVPVDSFVDWTSKRRIADERPFIRETVEYVGNINDYYLSFEEKSPLTEIDDWLETMEMPYKFYANSFWLKGIFEKAHEQNIGVLLNGQRGNTTISWGNALEYQLSLVKKLKWIRFYQEVNLYSENMGVVKSRVLKALREKAFPINTFEPDQKSILINQEFARKTQVYSKIKEHGIDTNGTTSWHEFRKKHFDQLFNWNINGTYATKLSLRYGVWDRDPTNDLRVVRFCLSIPDDQYVQNGLDRALIRRATKGYLPDRVRLNQKIRGIQGADGVHRMVPLWAKFIEELKHMRTDADFIQYINKDSIDSALSRISDEPRPEYIYDYDFSLLMRSLIVYRFIKKLTERR